MPLAFYHVKIVDYSFHHLSNRRKTNIAFTHGWEVIDIGTFGTFDDRSLSNNTSF
jgi:hypothetical protein